VKSNSRWWEFYLVRYFVGTVFGTLLIMLIVYSPDSGINNLLSSNKITLSGFKTNKFELSYLWLFGFIGLAYCYLSSAPILVFHSVRSVFKKTLVKNTFLKYLVIAILIFIVFLIKNWNLIIKTLGGTYTTLAILLALLIICTQFILLVFLFSENELFSFYKKLAEKRSVTRHKITVEYVESYRHLREHGNAFLILIMEIFLCFILYNLDSLLLISCVLTLWIFPAGFVWYIGTYLESRIHDFE